MGRFYETSDPNFVRDFVYTPPTDLFRLVAAKQQAYYDDAVNKISLLDSPVSNVNYLNGEKDRENVAKKQEYYNSKVQELLTAVQADPKNWRNNLGGIQELSKELQADLSTGDLADIQSSYNFNQQWEKEHKKIKESEPARYEALKKEAFSKYYQSGGDSTKSRWQQETAFKGLDYKDLHDQILKMKPEEISQSITSPFIKQAIKNGEKVEIKMSPSGGYFIEYNNKHEFIAPERIAAYVSGRVSENPEYMAGLKQTQRLGMGRYFNQNGALDILDENGKLNTKNSLASSIISGISAIGNGKHNADEKWTEDGAFTSRQSEANIRRGQNIDMKKHKDDLDYKNYALDYVKTKDKNDRNDLLLKMAYSKDASEEEKSYAKAELAGLNPTSLYIKTNEFDSAKKKIAEIFSDKDTKVGDANYTLGVNMMKDMLDEAGIKDPLLRKEVSLLLTNPKYNDSDNFQNALTKSLNKVESTMKLFKGDNSKNETNVFGAIISGPNKKSAAFGDKSVAKVAGDITSKLFGTDDGPRILDKSWWMGSGVIEKDASANNKVVKKYNNVTEHDTVPIDPNSGRILGSEMNKLKSTYTFYDLDSENSAKIPKILENMEDKTITSITHVADSPGAGKTKGVYKIKYTEDGEEKEAVAMGGEGVNTLDLRINNVVSKSHPNSRVTYALQNQTLSDLKRRFNMLTTPNLSGQSQIDIPNITDIYGPKIANYSVRKTNLNQGDGSGKYQLINFDTGDISEPTDIEVIDDMLKNIAFK